MQNRAAESPDRGWLDALRRAVDGVAGLTAVDGATVITDQYEVLAFGAKIVRRDGSSQVAEVIMTEPIEGARAEVIEPGQTRRHASPFGGAVRTRPARRGGARCLSGWPVHGLRLVALRKHGPRASYRDSPSIARSRAVRRGGEEALGGGDEGLACFPSGPSA
jgi:hypothetical protein